MERKITRRRGGPTLNMFFDVIADAWWTRNWFVAVVLVMGVLAAVLAFVGQSVLPWAIYPAL
ncbi:MAG: hypothetical protein ACKOYM_09965 [Actinomycetes bacterium]